MSGSVATRAGLAPAVRTSVIEHRGYHIRVRSRGDKGAPQAVVLNGMGANAHALAPQVRLLRCLGYATHVVELPGFGLGPPLRPEHAHLSQLAGYVVAAVRALGITRALFLGHSLGGGVALSVALSAPALVERLVLLNPAAVGDSLVWTYKLLALPVVGRALLRPQPRGARAYLRGFALGRRRRDDHRLVEALLRGEHPSRDAVDSMHAIVRANSPRGWRKLTCLVIPGREQCAFTLHPRLAELRSIPTLVLWGGDDRIISPRDASHFRSAHPAAEVHVAAGVGHLLPLEAPNWCSAHITRFVTLPAAGASRAA